ncbi:protein LIFEGUARD 4 [Cajanus cajan]|uniref:BI1-like protein n=1 Tax=Cajanus cajan TaxID=3821 RepID=A0A151U783_CAJCA|nr:protein LIFEGUARD 4 [Cajanus cajan]KYP75154.1 BI1-like protein [Cajanus cajan]
MGKGDIEAGFPDVHNDGLYPSMIESPQLRWGFIRKVYVIISIQLLFTAAFASIFIFISPVRNFAKYNPNRFFVFFGAAIVTIIVLFVLSKYYKKHPVNLFLLGLYTLGMSVTVGFACAFVDAKIVLEAAFLTGVVTASLTLYTFWAVKRGSDFSFLGPFLFASLMVMLLFSLIQVFFPLGPTGRMVIAGIGALIMCGFIVYDTDDLIKRFSYDDYIWAAIAIYGDIINLFIYLLTILNDL